MLVLIKMVISQKLLQGLILIYPRMPIVIREKWVWSNVYHIITLIRYGILSCAVGAGWTLSGRLVEMLAVDIVNSHATLIGFMPKLL